MAKRKINAAMIIAAGEDAHLQTSKKSSSEAGIGDEKFVELDIDAIEDNPMQPRLSIKKEELDELKRSIKLHGLIQPISVIQTAEGRYILKAGQRRLVAYQELGLGKIKAIVQEGAALPKAENEKALFEIAVMENTQRDNLNPLELALSLRQAMDKKLYKNLDELALALSKSKSYISKVLKVLALEDAIIEDLTLNRSTNDIESLYEIQKLKDKEQQVAVYFDFIHKKIDRLGIRELTKEQKVSQAKQPFQIKSSAKSIKVEMDTGKLGEVQKKSLYVEIQNLIRKYYKEIK
jgi:ParB family chromosome partitioning protein